MDFQNDSFGASNALRYVIVVIVLDGNGAVLDRIDPVLVNRIEIWGGYNSRIQFDNPVMYRSVLETR
jgi:hypothetical protein